MLVLLLCILFSIHPCYLYAQGDSWDPLDDTTINGTLIIPTTTQQKHGPHTLSATDLYDWFVVYLTTGYVYAFNTIGGSGDNYGELYSDSSGTVRVVADDDSGGNVQFSFSYIPIITQTYYLRIRAFSTGGSWNGYLNYYYGVPAYISGTVTDYLGNPVANAQVSVSGPSGGSTLTTSTGAYTISSLAEGTYSVTCRPPAGLNLAQQTQSNISIISGQTTTVNFSLVLGGIISGTVSDYQGQPVSNARIWAYEKISNIYGGWNYESRGSAFSTSSGTYTILGLVAGTYMIACQPPSGRNLLEQRKEDIYVVSGATTTVNFSLPLGGIISGVVTDSQGNPVANAQVSVSGPSGGSTLTTSTGAYTISSLAEGTYSVTCRPPAGLNLAQQTQSNISIISGQTTTVNFSLVLGGIISGTVSDYQGQPVSNAQVSAEGPFYNQTYTNQYGSYTITGLSEGIYQVYSRPPSYLNLIDQRIYNIYVVSAQTTTVNFSLAPGGIISGTVSDEEGQPVVNARIYGYGKETYTTTVGSYTLFGFAPGYYSITCLPPAGGGLIAETKTTYVELLQISTVNFVLGIGGDLLGEVTYYGLSSIGANIVSGNVGCGGVEVRDAQRNKIDTAWISIQSSTTYRLTYMTNNKFTAYGLPVGIYTVKVFPPRNMELIPYTYNNVSISRGQTTKLTSPLPIGGKIKGTITDRIGNKIANASIYVRGGSNRNITNTYEGVYVSSGLKGGGYKIMCIPPKELNFDPVVKENINVEPDKTITINFIFGEDVESFKTYVYPNPVYFAKQQSVNIKCEIPGSGKVNVKISIYNVSGDLVRTLNNYDDRGQPMNSIDRNQKYSFVWELKNENDERVASGIYLYIVYLDGKPEKKQIKKVAVIR